MNSHFFAAMRPLLSSILKEYENVEPENSIANFIRDNISLIPICQDEDIGMIVRGFVISMANKNPDMAEKTLILLCSRFGEWHRREHGSDNPC